MVDHKNTQLISKSLTINDLSKIKHPLGFSWKTWSLWIQVSIKSPENHHKLHDLSKTLIIYRNAINIRKENVLSIHWRLFRCGNINEKLFSLFILLSCKHNMRISICAIMCRFHFNSGCNPGLQKYQGLPFTVETNCDNIMAYIWNPLSDAHYRITKVKGIIAARPLLHTIKQQKS